MAWEVKPVAIAAHMFAGGGDPLVTALNELTENENVNPRTITIDRNPSLQGQVRIYYYREDT